MNEKRNKFGELSPKEIQEITDNAVPETTKRPYSSEWEYSTVRIRYVSRKKLQNFKYEHRDFTPSWRLCNNNNFHLNVTEWLASPGGTKRLKPIEEMSKEELNVFLKRFCTSARKKDRTLAVILQKFINEILLRAAIDRFLRARCRSTNHFPLSLTLLLLRQIKH